MSRSNFATALAVMSGAGLLGSMPGSAVANQVTQPSQHFSITNSVASPSATGTTTPSTSTPAGFTPFDTSLGTLTQVEVQLSGQSLSGFMSIFGAEGGIASQSDTFLILDPTLLPANKLMSATGNGTGTNAAVCPAFTNTCPDAGHAVTSNAVISGFTPGTTVDITSPTELTLFEAGGPTVDLGAEIDSTFSDTCNNPINANPPPVCTFGNTAGFSGDISVTYDYTPNVVGVSEPSSLALYGMAFAALGLVARRRDVQGRAGG